MPIKRIRRMWACRRNVPSTSLKARLNPWEGKSRTLFGLRMYVTDVSQWEKVAVVHGAVFGEIRPATTIVEVAKLIDDAALIEIEADAVVG